MKRTILLFTWKTRRLRPTLRKIRWLPTALALIGQAINLWLRWHGK
jgi:hypothetical protein